MCQIHISEIKVTTTCKEADILHVCPRPLLCSPSLVQREDLDDDVVAGAGGLRVLLLVLRGVGARRRRVAVLGGADHLQEPGRAEAGQGYEKKKMDEVFVK